MNKGVLIVDPLTSTKYLLLRFNELGYKVVALRTIATRQDIPDYSNLPFLKIVDSSGNLKLDVQTLKSIEGITLVAGMYGLTASVPYADQLLQHMFPNASNSPETSMLRLSKYAMTDALIQQGISHIKQLKLDSSLKKSIIIEKAKKFLIENKHDIIIKPDYGSTASIGVFSPTSEKDIETYFLQIKGNIFTDSDILLQQNIKGKQFYANTASYKGKHIVTGLGQYTKKIVGGNIVCLYDDHMDFACEDAIAIKSFALKTLNAVKMNNGLSHIELIKDNDTINLIEVNVRIAGAFGFLNKMAKNSMGIDQIDAYVSLLENRELTYPDLPKIFQRLVMIRHCDSEQKQAIKKLPSFSEMYLMDDNQAGQSRERYSSITNIIGLLLLKSSKEKEIIRDYELVFSWGLVAP